jgi:hypothetical protein
LLGCIFATKLAPIPTRCKYNISKPYPLKLINIVGIAEHLHCCRGTLVGELLGIPRGRQDIMAILGDSSSLRSNIHGHDVYSMDRQTVDNSERLPASGDMQR